MSWVWALIIVVGAYLAANIVVRRFSLFSSSLDSESLRELLSKEDSSVYLLDVRSAQEYRQGHIPTAVNIPHDSIGVRPPKVDGDTVIVLYCETGSRSMVAKRHLKDLGFTNVVNFGPLRRWRNGLIEGNEPGAAPESSGSSVETNGGNR